MNESLEKLLAIIQVVLLEFQREFRLKLLGVQDDTSVANPGNTLDTFKIFRRVFSERIDFRFLE